MPSWLLGGSGFALIRPSASSATLEDAFEQGAALALDRGRCPGDDRLAQRLVVLDPPGLLGRVDDGAVLGWLAPEHQPVGKARISLGEDGRLAVDDGAD